MTLASKFSTVITALSVVIDAFPFVGYINVFTFFQAGQSNWVIDKPVAYAALSIEKLWRGRQPIVRQTLQRGGKARNRHTWSQSKDVQ
jgi:hypothetical protein